MLLAILAAVLATVFACSSGGGGKTDAGGSGGAATGGAGGGGGGGGAADAGSPAAGGRGGGSGGGGGGSSADAAADLGPDQASEVPVLGPEPVYDDAFIAPWAYGTATQATVDTASTTSCFRGTACIAASFQPGGSFTIRRTPAVPFSNFVGLVFYIRLVSGTATALKVQLRNATAACSAATIPTVTTAWQRVGYITSFTCAGVGDVDEIAFASADSQPVPGVIIDDVGFP